jgi:DNA-binding winged helix-turn-helix (wHTH) protein/cytochrome c-type biogenesis protein CcmH/NrfG
VISNSEDFLKIMGPAELYTFGEFELEPAERRLSRSGETVALTPKAFDVLLVLIRNAGRLVTKELLLRTVWPDCFVEDGILAVHISSVRKGLGDAGRKSRYIETVPRSGYRFIAAVERRSSLLSHAAEVYELFGCGRSHLLAASRAEVPAAVAAFRAAIELDPAYGPAYGGLALAHCAQAEYRIVPHDEAFRDARTAAMRALELDDRCADAQMALGAVHFFGEWDWRAAESSLLRALELNPNHTEAYLLLGRLLEATGKVESGLAIKHRALERDPLSPTVHLQIALSHWHLRQYDSMIAWATKSLDLDPSHLVAREHIAAAWWKKGDFDRYLKEVAAHAGLCGAPPDFLDAMSRSYAEGGRKGFSRYVIQCVEQQPNPPAVQLAIQYGEIGDMDSAFLHLQRAIEQRDPCVVHLAVAPQWDTLRPDPRFSMALRQMGLCAG